MIWELKECILYDKDHPERCRGEVNVIDDGGGIAVACEAHHSRAFDMVSRLPGSEIHYLKTWPPYFQEVADGNKTFELRTYDRDYREGDILVLQEFVPDSGYTGRAVSKRVGFILKDGFGLPDNMCIMSLLEKD